MKFKVFLVIFAVIVSSSSLFAKSQQLNIFLGFDSKLEQNIKQFNSYLEENKLLQRYGIKPFINNHQAHLTLYLTAFPMKDVNIIIKKLQHVATNMEPFNITTSNIKFYSSSGFLMLNLNKSKQLQKVSNGIVKELSGYRDINYKIPTWAKANPAKVAVFKRYGSPNVFSEFSPHFSIFAAPINKNLQSLTVDLNNLINKYNYKAITTKATSINLGIADNNGQIIRVLKSFPLGKANKQICK